MPESDAVEQVLQAEREWLLAHLNCDVAELGSRWQMVSDQSTEIR